MLGKASRVDSADVSITLLKKLVSGIGLLMPSKPAKVTVQENFYFAQTRACT